MRYNRKTGGFAVTPHLEVADWLKMLPRFGSYAAVKSQNGNCCKKNALYPKVLVIKYLRLKNKAFLIGQLKKRP